VDEILGQVLRNAVWERLDMLAELANETDSPALLSAARSELPRLTEGWRVMLSAHEPDERGDCPTCSTRWHRCKAPCSVWQVAHDHLVAGGLAHFQDSRRTRRLRRASAGMPPAPRSAPSVPDTGRRATAQPSGKHALVGGAGR
jgi:hypothetical protein